jgi:hypothetical protein
VKRIAHGAERIGLILSVSSNPLGVRGSIKCSCAAVLLFQVMSDEDGVLAWLILVIF